MEKYIIGAILGIMIYSLILTIIAFYKDNSSYFMLEPLDIVAAGPCMWIIYLVILILRPIAQLFKNPDKKRIYKNKNDKYIAKITKRIVNNYRNKKYHNDYFKLDNYSDDYSGNFSGYESLLVKKPKNEWLNKKFISLMQHQKEQTIKHLLPYFVLLTKDMMIKDNCDEYYIKKFHDYGLYKLKPIENE